MRSSTTARQRYRIDLSAEHAECERNYARLLQLLPALAEQDTRRVGLPGSGQVTYQVCFTIVERSPYTTAIDLQISVHLAAGQALPFSLAQRLSLRLYHDAGMAEVVGFQSSSKPAGRYSYPNARMFQPDEKWQWNHFLGEWLAFCLTHGYSLAPLTVSDAASGIHATGGTDG